MSTYMKIFGFAISMTIGFLIGRAIMIEEEVPTNEIEIPAQAIETYRESDDVFYSPSLTLRYTQSDIECLQANIFHEARNQSDLGKIAVATVTVNRYYSNNFPNTICGVVTHGKKVNGKPVRNQCAFSWYCDGVGDRPNLKNKITFEAWKHAEKLARMVLNEDLKVLSNATHYHTKWVKPYWHDHPSMTLVKVVDDHIFYVENLDRA